MKVVESWVNFEPYVTNIYKVTVHRDRYKQLLRSTLYLLAGLPDRWFKMAVLERYGSTEYTYIAKLFIPRTESVKDVYQAIFDALSTTFGLPKIKLETKALREFDPVTPIIIYELDIEGSIYSYRTTGALYKALSTVVKNDKIKVMANVRRFARVDRVPSDKLTKFMNIFVDVISLKHEMSSLLQELQMNTDISSDEIEPYRNLYYEIVDTLRGIDTSEDGVYLSIFRTIEEAINSLNKIAEQMRNAIIELKKLYLKHKLIT